MKKKQKLRKDKMALSQTTLVDYDCPICRDIFSKPVETSCKHTFCQGCHDDWVKNSLSHVAECPICKREFDASDTRRATKMEAELRSCKGSCKGCSKRILLSKMREHNLHCEQLKCSGEIQFKPVAHTSQPAPSDVPNRFTFTCPYCDESNLDNNGLIQHVKNLHSNSKKRVVCPICASMPWGDPTLESANFPSHLNNRHKFDYANYVDYNEDEDLSLQMALKASLESN